MGSNLGTVDLKQQFHERGYRYTEQRQAIADFLWEHRNTHLTTDEVFRHMREIDPDMGKSTVHRTLHLLLELGMVHRLEIGDGVTRYEACCHTSVSHNHHHLICEECGRVIDMEEDLLDELELKVEQQYAFSITNHTLQFYGRCSNCRN